MCGLTGGLGRVGVHETEPQQHHPFHHVVPPTLTAGGGGGEEEREGGGKVLLQDGYHLPTHSPVLDSLQHQLLHIRRVSVHICSGGSGHRHTPLGSPALRGMLGTAVGHTLHPPRCLPPLLILEALHNHCLQRVKHLHVQIQCVI